MISIIFIKNYFANEIMLIISKNDSCVQNIKLLTNLKNKSHLLTKYDYSRSKL